MSAKPETVDDIVSRISATSQAKTVQAFSWRRLPGSSRRGAMVATDVHRETQCSTRVQAHAIR